MSEDRLLRIEEKLDKLGETLSKLAVVDERLTNLIYLNSNLSTRMTEMEKEKEKIVRLEEATKRMERVIWGGGAAVVAALLRLFLGG